MSWFDQIYRSLSTTLDELISKWEDANPDIVYDNAIQELKRQHQQISTVLAGIIVQKEKNEAQHVDESKDLSEGQSLRSATENDDEINDLNTQEKQGEAIVSPLQIEPRLAVSPSFFSRAEKPEPRLTAQRQKGT